MAATTGTLEMTENLWLGKMIFDIDTDICWCLVWYLKLLLVLCSKLLLLLNYGSSVFQTDIQFSINPFDFSNMLPDEKETFKRMCLQLINTSSSLQADESKHREKRILKQKHLV